MSDPRGIGLYRGAPAPLPDDLKPGQQPSPSTGQPGPARFAFAPEQSDELAKALDRFIDYHAGQGMDKVAGVATTQTSGTGGATFSVYHVGAGQEGKLHRLTMNAINPGTGSAYTPQAPYTNAGAASVQIYQADNGQAGSIGFTGLHDFGPPTATDPIFPCVFSWGWDEAPVFKGPITIAVVVTGGPNSTQIMARYSVSLCRLKGLV